ncbi:MAG: ATP-binding cassette domain-containing protein, partial [Planctomycetes bacterium]|nr:ATP-binding cassette domain-containing protein [Planctomycetota bacterium]
AFEREIEFRGVRFSYGGEKQVLRGISFKVRKGERVALLGLTGAGKTTIASLLCRFYDPQEGGVLVDGLDLREIAQADLRAKIGLILQDVFLFPGDIASNVRLGRTDMPREKIEAACTMARAQEFIAALPKGYETELSERAQNLSTGQRQLLAFARALAYDPQILVLDEATSSVDGKTESLIQEAMATLLKDRTALIIAHRMSSVLAADRILVLQQGQVVEEGTHASLLAAGGLYAKFFELQFGRMPADAGPCEAPPALAGAAK